MTPPRSVAVGIGNLLRSDDGVGIRIVEALGPRSGPDIAVKTVHQLTPELAEALQGAPRVAFVDAALDLKPGEVSVRVVEPEAGLFSTPHALTPAEVLAVVRYLGSAAPAARWFTVGVACVDHGVTLSRLVADAMEPAAERVLAWLRAPC